MTLKIDLELMEDAQKVINQRGVLIPLNRIARAYEEKFKNYKPTETVTIGEREFLCLNPQEVIGAETALLAFLQDLEVVNTSLLRTTLAKAPKTIYKKFPDIFPELDDSIRYFEYILKKDFISEEEKLAAQEYLDSIKDNCSDDEYSDLLEAAGAALEDARSKMNEVNKPLPLMLFIAAGRQISGPPITVVTEQLELPETIEEIRSYVGKELVKLR